MNNYKQHADKYLKKGYAAIPDKYGSKMPAIRGWSDHCYKLPEEGDVSKWKDIGDTNIAVCLGEASGIIALDVDTDRPEILALINSIMPESPVEKRGSKGYTRFFRYMGQQTEQLKFNGEVILEILSNGKKTTMPPSKHPNGSNYVWMSEKELHEIDASSLPILPPMLISHLASKLKITMGGQEESYGKVVNGRNDELSKYLGTLLEENHVVDDVLRKLVEKDKEINEVPLFSDTNEFRHSDTATNALLFYSNHLNSINSKRFRESKQYLSPVMEAVASIDLLKESAGKKSQAPEKPRKSKAEFLLVDTALKKVHETILKNSWIKQPDLALGASLALFATLCSRKFVFQGMSPNLYICGISPSGTGKDSPQQAIKEILGELRAEKLLGAGDYVSDASLMDSFALKKVRLDIMDEVGGILRTVNSGKSEFNSKMADVLAELYTSSNGFYMGRATAEGVKGSCDRPNVNILGSTTPTGFREGVSKTSIQKGLMGRFLLFMGDEKAESTRVKKRVKVPQSAMNQMSWLRGYVAPENVEHVIQDKPQMYVELKADKDADKRLDEIFTEFDQRRIKNITKPSAPIIARLYQQMIKLVIIHACARETREVPNIKVCDVDFGYNVITAYYEEINGLVAGLMFDSKVEQDRHELIEVIRNNGPISKQELIINTPKLPKRIRESMLTDLTEAELISTQAVKDASGKVTIYYGVNG